MASIELTVIVGNPQPKSRTATAATEVADQIAHRLQSSGQDVRITSFDLADIADGLVSWGDARVAAAKTTVLGADLLVVASPTYKACFTGLIKLFLDQFGSGELNGIPTVAMMTGGSPAHSLAVDVHLRPVLIEIGASCPTAGLYLSGPDIDAPHDPIAAWMESAGPILERIRW